MAVVLAALLLTTACTPTAPPDPGATAPTPGAASGTPAVGTLGPTRETSPSPSETRSSVTPTAGGGRISPSPSVRLAPDILACGISASGGLEDKHANSNVYRGMDQAGRERAVAIDFLESGDPEHYVPNIQGLIARGCDIVIAVGHPLSSAVDAAAAQHPDRKFVIVDPVWPSTRPNVASVTFRAEEAAMLAGYLGAGMTRTGTVGTYGGVQEPATTAVMDGLAAGVQYYNLRYGTSVRLIGWYPGPRDRGLFVGDVEDRAAGRRLALQLIAEGADIVVPVAGGASLGGAAAIQDAGAVLIGVETDQYETSVEFGDVTLTSILRRADRAVYQAIIDAVDGRFSGGTYTGDLRNGGVALAPLHRFADTVPSGLLREVDELRARIVAGEVKVRDHVR